MSLTLADVEKIANLARLDLSETEKNAYLRQLTAVLDYAEMLNELDLEGVEPTAHAIPRRNIMRDDIVEPSLPTDDAFINAFRQIQDQFWIQSVLDD